MKYFFIIFFLIIFSSLSSQTPNKDEALARHYFQTRNYEKASIILEELVKENSTNRNFYNMLFSSLIRMNEYDRLEKIVKKEIKKNKKEVLLQIDLAYVYSQNNKLEKSKTINENIIKELTEDEYLIRRVASKYTSLNQSEYLLKTFEKGNKLFRDNNKFAFELGLAFIKLNKLDNAINYFLDFIGDNNSQLQRVKNILTRNLDKEGFQNAIETQLYARIQDKPNKLIYPELLIWLFTNQKDFESALIQAKALDKRNKEEGIRVIMLSNDALGEEDYQAAILGFEYIISKGEKQEYFKMAKSGILNARKLKILKSNDFTKEDLTALKKDYTSYLEEYGKTTSSVSTIRELANLEANYLNNVAKGISMLIEALNMPNLKRKVKNELKLELADMYILSGDVWESVLLYAQVDKEEKDSPLGEDARFRNAKLSYYIGEFEWAQAQLLVLKGATSELIANDALKLSIFIIDNLGLDTSSTAIEMYSKAELLMIQNKKDEAINQLDKILKQFPQHALEDDIYFKKSEIYILKKDFSNAEKNLLKLLQSHKTDVLGDNATFNLAQLYNLQLNNKIKAKEYYEKIILEYSSSVLLVEARKKYRQLRGDNL